MRAQRGRGEFAPARGIGDRVRFKGPNSAGRTALAGSCDCCSSLLHRGAGNDPYKLIVALRAAASEGHKDVCSLLVSAGAEPLSALEAAAKAGGRNAYSSFSARTSSKQGNYRITAREEANESSVRRRKRSTEVVRQVRKIIASIMLVAVQHGQLDSIRVLRERLLTMHRRSDLGNAMLPVDQNTCRLLSRVAPVISYRQSASFVPLCTSDGRALDYCSSSTLI